MRTENENYTVHDSDSFTPGYSLKMEHSVNNRYDTDLTSLIAKGMDELVVMRDNNVELENIAYSNIQAAFKVWENIAVNTGLYDRAIEYLKVPEVSHTSNKWVQGDNGYFHKSNRVYEMSYKMWESCSWRTNKPKWEIRWQIYTNSPIQNNSYRIVEREKVCNTKEEAEKYIQGRIKAYDNLFVQINPPIPDDYRQSFCVFDNLLPGYITESMQKELDGKAAQKPSVKNQLNELKSQSKEKSKPEPSKKRNEIEIE